jgi:hypothetical protein
VTPREFNSYGSRRGNDNIMARGTFANIRLVNKLTGGKAGPKTVHLPSNETLDIYDAAQRYIQVSIYLLNKCQFLKSLNHNNKITFRSYPVQNELLRERAFKKIVHKVQGVP